MQPVIIAFAFLQVCAVQQETKLVPGQAQPGAYFGRSLDLGPGRLAVGAPGLQAPYGGLKGAVYIFDKFGNSWVQQALLGDSKATQLTTGADFGISVALDGDRVATGAPGAYVTSSVRGQVFLFVKQGLSWLEEMIIDNPATNSVLFGTRLDLEGDTLVIGSPPPYVAYSPKPAVVYVYHRGPMGWAKQASLEPQDEVDAEYFGSALALQGDTAFVGSPGSPEDLPLGVSAKTRGAVHVYQRTGTTWALKQFLAASDGKLGDLFGSAISVSGNTLLITSPRAENSQLRDVGAVYLFEWNGNAWVEREKMLVHGGSQVGMAGQQASLEGGVFVLSGLGLWEQVFAGGAFYLFSRIGSLWTENLKISPTDDKNAGNYSFSVGVHGSTVAVGAPWNNGLATYAGAVYVYSVQTGSLQPAYYCKPKLSGHCIPRITHWGQPSVSGAAAGEKYEIWGWEVAFNQWSMLVYSLTGPASTPFKGGTLCLTPPIVRTKLQPSQIHNGLQEPCYTTLRYDFNERIKSGVDPALQAGQQVWFQYWSRDKTFLPPNNVGLTDAVTAIICQ